MSASARFTTSGETIPSFALGRKNRSAVISTIRTTTGRPLGASASSSMVVNGRMARLASPAVASTRPSVRLDPAWSATAPPR
jgi:hypothetical protein